MEERTDDTEIVIVMHKKTAGNFAFTKTVDDMIKADPDVRDAFGFDNLYYKVDPTNGSEPLVIEYQNKNGDHRKNMPLFMFANPKGAQTKRSIRSGLRSAWSPISTSLPS